MRLDDLQAASGARRTRRRIGRGLGSGRGTTAGKGTKGQKARAGGGVPPYFEGGQLPLVKRLPHRRGFFNQSRVEHQPVNVGQLAKFKAGDEVGPDQLVAAGLAKSRNKPIAVLGSGELTVKLTVRAHRFSASAREKIEKAGGKAEAVAGA